MIHFSFAWNFLQDYLVHSVRGPVALSDASISFISRMGNCVSWSFGQHTISMDCDLNLEREKSSDVEMST